MPIFARILDEKYIKTFFMINPIVKTIELPDGRTITLETGKLAKQADGSVMLRRAKPSTKTDRLLTLLPFRLKPWSKR